MAFPPYWQLLESSHLPIFKRSSTILELKEEEEKQGVSFRAYFAMGQNLEKIILKNQLMIQSHKWIIQVIFFIFTDSEAVGFLTAWSRY